MEKEKYIEAITEIKASDSFKQNTVSKMQQAALQQNLDDTLSADANHTSFSENGQGAKYTFKRWLAAGCIFFAFIFSSLAYAGVIDLSRVYQKVFGIDYGVVQQHIEPIAGEDIVGHSVDHLDVSGISGGVESISDGIVMKLVSAINAEDALRIFVTATDITGDRLSESIRFDSWGLSQGHGGNISVVDYDEKTKTATLLITSLGEDHAGSAELSINGFISDRTFYEGVEEPGLDLYNLMKSHIPGLISQDNVWVTGGAFPDEEREAYSKKMPVLATDEIDISFDNIGWSRITNIGFVDERLHIQTRTSSDFGNDLASINLLDKHNQMHQGHFFLRYAGDQNSFFEYKEMVYDGITELEQLRELSVTVDYLEEGDSNEGFWHFSFEVPEKATIDVNIQNNITINGNMVDVTEASISPLGITIELPENIASQYGHTDTAAVIYKDGTMIHLDQTRIDGNNDRSMLIFSGNMVEIEKVQQIVINSEIIALF